MTNISDTLAALSEAAIDADREAAKPIMRHLYDTKDASGADELFVREVLAGKHDDHYIVQAFAAHRRNVITEAIRTGQLVPVPSVEVVARAIHEEGSDIPWEVTSQRDIAINRARAVIAAIKGEAGHG